MPRIEEYGTPTVESQVPLDVSSRPIEEAGQMGRAVQSFGKQFDNLADMHYKRVAQEEVANAQVDFANARAEWTDKLNKQIQTGDVDPDKLMEDYQSSVDDMADKYQTAHGQQVFDRQNALTKSMLLRGAVNAKAHLAGEQAKAAHQTTVDSNSNAIYNNPADFLNIYNAHMEGIDDQVESMGLPAGAAEKLKTQDAAELAKSAVRGWAQIDPDKAEQLLNGTNTPDKKGAWDEFFNADVKHQLQGEINTQKRANEADITRQDMLEKKAKEKATEAWKLKNLDRMQNGELSAQEIVKAGQNGTLTYEGVKEQLGVLERVSKGDTANNYQVVNDLTRRIYADDNDPQKIRDSSVIDRAAAQGHINVTERNRLVEAVNGTPEGQNLRANKKNLLTFMDAQLVKKDSMLGISDPMGERNLAAATQALQQKEDEYRKAGKPLSGLYDPSNKDSFYNQALSFKLTPKQIMQNNMDQMKAQNDAKDSENNADKTKAALPRLPGETMDAWIKRKRGSK